jgi:hypothetical protein
MFAFFGMLGILAATVDLANGRYDFGNPLQLLHGVAWLLPGLLLFRLGVSFLYRDRNPASAPFTLPPR